MTAEAQKMRFLFFDIDGTLVDAAGAGRQAMMDALRLRWGDLATTDGVGFAGRTDRSLAMELFALHGAVDVHHDWDAFRESYEERLRCHLPAHPARMLPGVPELIETLHQRADVGLALLTGNTRAAANCKLAHFDLWRYFPCGGFGDHHEDRQEVARAAVRAAEDHFARSLDPQTVWVIGDTPRDIECARAIGAHCLAVATGPFSLPELESFGPDEVVSDLADVEAILQLWET